MPHTSSPVLEPAAVGRPVAASSVAVLEARPGLAPLLGRAAGLAVRAARTLDELVALAEAGAADAAVVDPELGEGWPTDVAEAALRRLGGRVPLVLACRSPLDAAVLEARVSGREAVVVLVRDRLGADGLAAVLLGEAARRVGA